MDDFDTAIKQDIALKVTENKESVTKASFLLIVAKQTSLTVRVDKQAIMLNSKQALLVRAAQDLHINTQSYTCMCLSGALVTKHLGHVKTGELLSLQTSSLGTVVNSILASVKTQGADVQASLALDLLTAIATYTPPEKKAPALVQNAEQMILREYGFLYGVEDLADRLAVNKSHLIRVFKQVKGITPGQFLENKRIENAKHMLTDATLSLEMIAGLCGYANANYFGKVFKRISGISPHAFRSAYLHSNYAKPIDVPDEYYL